MEDIDPSERRILHELFVLVDADNSGEITDTELTEVTDVHANVRRRLFSESLRVSAHKPVHGSTGHNYIGHNYIGLCSYGPHTGLQAVHMLVCASANMPRGLGAHISTLMHMHMPIHACCDADAARSLTMS